MPNNFFICNLKGGGGGGSLCFYFPNLISLNFSICHEPPAPTSNQSSCYSSVFEPALIFQGREYILLTFSLRGQTSVPSHQPSIFMTLSKYLIAASLQQFSRQSSIKQLLHTHKYTFFFRCVHSCAVCRCLNIYCISRSVCMCSVYI